MKVKVNREAALDALQLALAVAGGSGKADVSSLRDVRLEAEGSELRITATDYEIGLHNAVPAEVGSKGAVMVPAHRLVDILRESDSEEVELVSSGAHLKLKMPGSKYTINGLDPSEFPDVPDPDVSGGPAVDAARLRDMVRRVSYAAASERSRYTLNGVRWEAASNQKKGGIRLVATDGRRLAMDEIAAEKKVKKLETGIVPIKATAILEKVLAGAADEALATVRIADNRLIVAVGSVRFSALLLEGQYPDYRGVIREPGEVQAETEAASLCKSVRQAAVASDSTERSVIMTIESGTTTLTSRSSGVGGGAAEVQVGELDWSGGGEKVEAAFDVTYLLDALKAFGTERVTLDVKSAKAAAILRSGGDYLAVVMPITLPD